MMLLIIWANIAVVIGHLKPNDTQYFLFSLGMLVLSYYLANKTNPIILSLREAIIISVIPNGCLWYYISKCNTFLWVHPYPDELVMTVFLIYSYILIYIASECK